MKRDGWDTDAAGCMVGSALRLELGCDLRCGSLELFLVLFLQLRGGRLMLLQLGLGLVVF